MRVKKLGGASSDSVGSVDKVERHRAVESPQRNEKVKGEAVAAAAWRFQDD